MKKFISLVVILVIALTALCGCTQTSDSQPEAPSTEIDISIFPEVEATSENLDIYREEVSKRTENPDDIFISAEDWNVIQLCWDGSDVLSKTNISLIAFSKLYKETSTYYYPVVFRDGESLILWYTSESGYLQFDELHGYGNLRGNYGGEVHHDTSDEETISQSTDYTVTYNQKTGEVKVWQFGEVEDTFTGIPAGSVYCGFSAFEGYIFRNGTDVYSLNAVDTHNADGSVECIAHNVKYVIDADYYYGSDPWCQPLFQMTDGSIKCYIGWEGNEDAAPDDSSHLCDLQYEGGYR